MLPYTLVDGIRGWGQYAGTSLTWGANNSGWWGEGGRCLIQHGVE